MNQQPAMPAKALIVLAIAAVACIAVFSLNSERTDVSEAIHETVSVSSRASGGVMRSIVDLKAYCIGARPMALKLKKLGKQSSIIPFIIAFGSTTNKDLVNEYATIMGKMRTQYLTGLGAFLLDRLNKAVLTGKGVTIVGHKSVAGGRAHRGSYILIDSSRLGLLQRPDYFRTLAVSIWKHSSLKARLHKGKVGKAVKAWIKSGNAEVYKMFFAKISSKFLRQRQIQDGKEEAGAVLAEHAAYKEEKKKKKDHQQVMEPMPPAGRKGGQFIRAQTKFKMPKAKVIKKLAMKKALEYMATEAKKDDSFRKVAKAIESKLEGTTIRITTAGHRFADSTIMPLIELKGSLGTLRGKIKALPLNGLRLEQTFGGKPIGTIKQVTLKIGKTANPWLCSKFEVQVGVGSPWTTVSPHNGHKQFWLDGRPYNHGPYFGLPRSNLWVLRASGSARTTYKKKYSKKWPHCSNIKCMLGDEAAFEVACSKIHECNGFSYTAGKSKGGSGCLKKHCAGSREGFAGYGHHTHDYYEKFMDSYQNVLLRRRQRAQERLTKARANKEATVKMKKRNEKRRKESIIKAKANRKQRAAEKAFKKKHKNKIRDAKEKHAKVKKAKARQAREKAGKERSKKKRIVRNTCTVMYYKHMRWNKFMGSVSHYCGTKTFRFPRKVEGAISSFKLSSGCNWVEVWDKSRCRKRDTKNRWYSFAKQPRHLPWSLNDSVCAVRVNSKC